MITVLACVPRPDPVSRPLSEVAEPPADVVPVVVWADDAPPWDADDRIVSDPRAQVSDPEFDLVTGSVTFASAEGELWVGTWDPATGAVEPPDLRGTLVDTDIAPFTATLNGPEWAQSDRGAVVLYAKDYGAGHVLMQASWDGASWNPAPVDGVPGRAGSIGSQEPGDPDPRIVFVEEATGDVRWSHLDGREGGRFGHALLHGPRFTLGHRSVAWADGVDGVRQVFAWDHDLEATTVLTARGTAKGNPWMWVAPEYGERLFFATGADAAGDPVTLDIYREVDGRWQIVKSIVPPADHPYVLSPEPIASGGHSLVVFQASISPDALGDPSEIWVATAAPERDELRRVSGAAVERALDPEWVEIGGRPMVYYTRVAGPFRTLDLCAVGLP